MKCIPKDIAIAIDTNHATDPVDMINTFGNRVHTLHVSDGNGIKDQHAMPGKGNIKWEDVLTALTKAGYMGPFLYEVKGKYINSFSQLSKCYDKMYAQWIKKYIETHYQSF